MKTMGKTLTGIVIAVPLFMLTIIGFTFATGLPGAIHPEIASPAHVGGIVEKESSLFGDLPPGTPFGP